MRRLPAVPPPPSRVRAIATGLPIAIAGSLVVTLGAEAASAAEYTVQPGDTVSGIAGRHGLRTADVLSANGLGWSTTIHPGQTLSLGAPPAAATPPAPAPAAPPAPVTHPISAGDTIGAVARAHGLSTEAVLAANGLGWSSIIYPGQTLTIPSAAAAAAPAPVVAVAAAAPAVSTDLDAEQIANAQTIIRVGRELGVSDRGIAIALGTAMVESWLRNLDWGDRDSVGLFQQRPSAGWGTAEEAMDPVRATRAFFGGAGDPNGTSTRGLLDIPGWEAMAFADAAQSVQISAFPDRYTQWEQPATTWVAVLG